VFAEVYYLFITLVVILHRYGIVLYLAVFSVIYTIYLLQQ